jgi:ankyrin repeat protein
VEACKLLIESQADINAKDNKCDARPLRMLLETKAVLRICFERCNSCLLFREQTALHDCSAARHVDKWAICKLLVESQADVNAKGQLCDARPLHMLLQMKAGLRFCLNVVTLLFSGRTALHISSDQGDLGICGFLVKHCQADVNVKDNRCGARPLHILLKTKAGLRICFECYNSCLLFSGRTALHMSKGHLDVCKLLVESQADVNAKDNECDARPLHMHLKTKAGLRFCFERCNSCLLFSHETILHLNSQGGWSPNDVMMCKLLVESQADVNTRDNEYDALLIHAFENEGGVVVLF